MKVIVMGCGRVGEQVSLLLTSEGHNVAVIDYDASALERLGPDFNGRRIRGVGFDRDVLVEAGIEDSDGFAATSSSDNANIVSARIARNVFHVPHVVARLFDPRRAEIYRRLGLMTISSSTWGAERIYGLLMHTELDPLMAFGSGETSLFSVEAPLQLVGNNVRSLNISGEIQVVSITRHNRAFIPLLGTDFQVGDIIHVVVLASSMSRFQTLLGLSD